MSRRKTLPLTPAEYVSRDPNQSSQVYWARAQLIEAAWHVYREMLERLSADVFPRYSRLAKLGGLDRIPSAPDVSAWDALPGDSELKPALSRWAIRFQC